MAGISEQSFDPKLTVVVLNIPSNVGDEDITIHFQKAKHGGGDVGDVVVDGSVAFVTFDLPEVATSVLNHEQIIINSKVQVQSYESWLANKKDNIDNKDDSPTTDEADGIKTIYVGGIKDSTTEDAITFFFENKKRTGGGDLCEGTEGCKRVAPTVARLTFASSKDAQNVLEKAKEKPLRLEGNLLKVSTVFEPTHDRSILLAKNLNPQTNKETFGSFVEFKRNADVRNIVFGKDGRAIVILNSEIGEDYSDERSSNEDMELNGSIISLEFAPLTKRIKVSNIPQGTSKDDVRYKFSSRKIGGGQVTNVELNEENGVANVYFGKSSVVSELVKKEHIFQGVPLTVIPYYDNFEELQEITTKTTEFSDNYQLDPLVMDYIMIHQEIGKTFDFKSMKYDKVNSRFHFTKDFDDPKLAAEFENKLKDFLCAFVKEDVKIPKGVFEKVKEVIKSKREEFEAEKLDFSFDVYRITFVGKKEDVTRQKQAVEAMIDTISEEAKFETAELVIDDQNKLKFLNFVDYFKKLFIEFPGVKIHGMESTSGKLSLLGTAEKAKDLKLRILEDLVKISEIEVKLSDHQISFLKRTDCQIVNDVLKNDDVMLMLTSITTVVGAKSLQAKIFSLKKCNDDEKKRVLNIVHVKTSEKCIKVDEETARFLAKSDKLQEFKKEQFDKHQVLIDSELTVPGNLWIVCEKYKMDNAEQELTSLTDEKKISSSTFKLTDPMKIRFFKEHCWDKIKENETNCKAEGVVVTEIDSDSLEVKGTQAGRKEVITFLETLAKKVEFKTFPLTEPGMKKQMSMEATNEIISVVEKNHKCIIEKDIQPKKTREKPKEATVATDGAMGAGASGATTNLPATINLPAAMNLPHNSMSFVNDKEVKMASGQRITIVIGDLAMQKVDVIVNTTNDSVDLNANACGKALLKVAGIELVNECKKIGGIKAGEMASTGPAKLNCKRVYHVRSSSWDNGKGALILRQLIKKCLDQVEKDKLTSIAIPAIGTGNLHCPRSEVAKVLFEEVRDYLTAHPQSPINDIRFVAYSGDQPSVDAFLGAVQNIKSMVLSPPGTASVRLSTSRMYKPNAGSLSLSEKLDGSLEFFLGSRNLTVQIVCADITNEKTDLIMHVITRDFTLKGGVAKALIKAGGDTIVRECKALGQPAIFSTQYTTAGKLAVSQIAHVIAPDSYKVAELKKCLDAFFDDVSKKNIARISFSAVGAGAMGLSEIQSADLIFDNLSRIAESKNSRLSLVRIVIFEKPKFDKFKDATKAYLSARGPTSSTPLTVYPYPQSFHFRKYEMKKRRIIHERSTGEDRDISIKLYSDDREKIDRAWGELERKICQNIEEKTMTDDDIKKFTDRHLEQLRKLERDFDVKIEADQGRGSVKIKGHISDISNIQEEIRTILKKISDNESKVPDYWDSSMIGGVVHKVKLSTRSKEYKEVETAFKNSAPNQIVSIDRIQNRDIYESYNVKHQAMMKKYGRNFAGKELMLFHGTSCENIEKINSGGLNRIYAGIHATAFGRGVYFARDASYSCQTKYSPPDPQGHRYMYYAKVLVGDYTLGNNSIIVAPNKNTGDPNETFDSVVDNTANPSIYVLFQDYEYYTEYLITFK